MTDMTGHIHTIHTASCEITARIWDPGVVRVVRSNRLKCNATILFLVKK